MSMSKAIVVRCASCKSNISVQDPFAEYLNKNKGCPCCGIEIVTVVNCASCKATILSHKPLDQLALQPCPICAKPIDKKIGVPYTLASYDVSKLVVKDPCLQRPTIEQHLGKRHSHKLGHFVKLRRIIDRVRDWYSETVTDPSTGEVIHKCEEPLRKHTGHGSAKRK